MCSGIIGFYQEEGAIDGKHAHGGGNYLRGIVGNLTLQRQGLPSL